MERLPRIRQFKKMKFKAGTIVGFDENGKVKYSELIEDTKIQGVKFKAGTEVGFYENGNIFVVLLAENTTIRGIKFKTGTESHFLPKRKVCEG